MISRRNLFWLLLVGNLFLQQTAALAEDGAEDGGGDGGGDGGNSGNDATGNVNDQSRALKAVKNNKLKVKKMIFGHSQYQSLLRQRSQY